MLLAHRIDQSVLQHLLLLFPTLLTHLRYFFHLQHLQALLAMKAKYYQMDHSPLPNHGGAGSMPGSRTQSANDARRGAGGSRGSGGSAGNAGGGLGADYKSGGGGIGYDNFTPAHAEYRSNSRDNRDHDAKGSNFMSFEDEYDN